MRLWRQVLYGVVLWYSPSAQAGQVTLTMPDAQLKGAIEEVCLWSHCESPDNGGYKSDSAKAQWVMEHLLEVVSMQHYHHLSDLGATFTIHYDQPLESAP